MKIESIRIRNFRSISDLTLDLDDLTALCGENSSGKSNVLRAIRYALTSKGIDRAEVINNLPAKLIRGQGAPRLSTWIDIKFSECPSGVAKIVGQKKSSAIEYNFRAMRSGTVFRKLMGYSLDEDSFSELLGFFDVIYIPPIRDLNNGGIEPFHRAFSTALAKARGVNNLRNVERDAKGILESRADTVLVDQKQLLKTHAGVDDLKIDCSEISLDDLYEKVSLAVTVDGHDLKIDDLGTGHQSLLIMDLFEHLESSGDASRLFLFEEPDNHLHPSAIRTVSAKMMNLSKSAQVLATTHSPIFIHAVGMNAVLALSKNAAQETIRRKIDLSGYTDKQLSSILLKYGLRVTEALFCKKAIVVEGPADVLTLKVIHQIREGCPVDDKGILIVDAGGKSGVKELLLLFDKLSVPCMAMLDWDAVEAGKLPQYLPGDDENARQAIETLKQSIPENRATKKGVLKALESLIAEVENPVSGDIKIYNGSTCEGIVNQLDKLTKAELHKLITGLKVRRKTWYTPLLKKSCLWVHDKDLEHTIISTPRHAQAAQNALGTIGIAVSFDMSEVQGFLHNSANRPEVFEIVISALEEGRLFSKTRFNTMYSIVFN